MTQIKDITVEEIKQGNNWKVTLPDDLDTPLQEWQITPASSFQSTDHVAYSALLVTDDGDVYPLIQVKEVGYLDYGGNYCEYQNGQWRELGLVPNPDAPHGIDYVADPLENDPSFNAPDHDYRKWHRDNFQKWIAKLP